MSKLVYIAAPYSHDDPNVVERRIRTFYRISSQLMLEGRIVISPLLNHPLVKYESVPSDWNYWKEYSIRLLSRCDELLVLKFPGWDKSSGVAGEIKEAEARHIPVTFMDVELLPLEEEPRDLLWNKCVEFRERFQISCPESIWQVDRIQVHAPELVEAICNIVGYHEYID